MKRNLFYLLMLVCSISLFTACSDDDDKPTIANGEIDGAYLGALDVDAGIAGTQTGIPQKIYITKTGDAQVKMELKNFSYPGIGNLGNIELDGLKVEKTGSIFALAGSGNVKLIPGDCALTVAGTIENGKLIMNITVKVAVLNVIVDFEGTKMAADKSSEAEILTFTVNSPLVIGQPVFDKTNISFAVVENATEDQLKELAPTFTISEGATVDKQSGDPQDFTQPVTYTLKSEDGITTKTYTVTAVKGKNQFYNMELWEEKLMEGEPSGIFSPVGGWDSSNLGTALIKMMVPGYAGDTQNGVLVDEEEAKAVANAPDALEKVEDARTGTYAAKISTINSVGVHLYDPNADFQLPDIPRITAGTLFLGQFITDMANTLNSTKFGVMWSHKPIKVTGYYKYTPGDVYHTCADPVSACYSTTISENEKDACAISAVLYEVANENEECLTGVNIFTSTDKIVAMAQFTNDRKVTEYTKFELNLDYVKSYDPAKKYRFAVIASSSKNGDKFSGAPGSTLYLDDIEITNE